MAKVKFITEYGYFGRTQNLRDVRPEPVAPSLASMVASIDSLPTRAEREVSRAASNPASLVSIEGRD